MRWFTVLNLVILISFVVWAAREMHEALKELAKRCNGGIKEKLTLSDIRVGMHVYKEQLSEIKDTYIILVRHPEDEEYVIKFIGKDLNEESDALFSDSGNYKFCIVYNDSLDADPDVMTIG